MTPRPLGQSGLCLSPLSLGTVKFGRNQSVKYPSRFDLPDDKAICDLLAKAHEHGITTLDTAPAYGIAEQRLGQLLTNRHDWQIITKAGEYYDAASDSSHYDFNPKTLRQSLDNSLRLLNTDYIDCWLIHSDGNDLANLSDEAIKLLQEVKQAGLVRTVGMSTKTVAGGAYALEHLDCIMMAASLNNQEEAPLFEVAAKLNKGLLLKKIYDSGWALTADNKQDIMQQTLARLFAQPAVCSAVIGTINPLHLQQNIDALNAALRR